MLQHDDDRWPMWEQDLGDDDQSQDQAKAEDSGTQGSPGKGGRKASVKAAAPKGESFSDSMQYVSLGTELFAAVLIGTLLAWGVSWLIGKLIGYQPTWIIAIGVVIGAIAGFLNMYRALLDIEKKEKRQKRGSSR